MRPIAAVIVASTLLVGIVSAHDLAASTTATTDQAADDRHLGQLCGHLGDLQAAWIAAVESAKACVESCCPTPEQETSGENQEAARRGCLVVRKEYRIAMTKYQEKYGTDPEACEAATAEAYSRIAERQAPVPLFSYLGGLDVGPKRSECEEACRELGVDDACIANCGRYPETATNSSSEAHPPTPGTAIIPATGSRVVFAYVFEPSTFSYMEGALPFVRVRRGGKVLVEQEVPATPLSFSLAPGTYELSSYVRPCDANCDYLDEPTDECHAHFTIKADQDLHVTSVARAGVACQLTIR